MTNITTATSLSGLAEALNSLAAACAASSRKLEDIIDLTSLPVFGGDEPADTTGIWSWDAERVLLSDGGRWYVAAR